MKPIAQTLPSSVEKALQSPQLAAIVHAQNGPVSVHFPEVVHEAVMRYRAVLDEHDVFGKIFTANKATSSPALMKASVEAGGGCDIASVAEYEQCSLMGIADGDMIATGPKPRRFLELLAKHPDVVIVIDSLSELERFASITRQHHRVLLRMNREFLNDATINKTSRFGLSRDEWNDALTLLRQQERLLLIGVAFHLDSQSVDERITAVERGMDMLGRLQDEGWSDATVLDIGGGFGASYGMASSARAEFEAELKKNLLANDRSAYWGRHSYGLRVENGGVVGSIVGIDASDSVSEEHRLDMVLRHVTSSGQTIAERVNEELVELWCEPGAGILHSAGIVAAEVIECRERNGVQQVVVDIHRNQLCFEGNETLNAPLLVPTEIRDEPAQAYALLGHLCAENDVLSYRLVTFSQTPRPGDIIVWTHTGAYRSHFSASRAIGHPLAQNYLYTTTFEKEQYDT